MTWAKSSIGGDKGTALEMTESLLKVEAQSLKDRYSLGERRSEEQLLLHNGRDGPLFERKTQLEAIRAKCREFELISFNSATLRKEQERELSSENEQKRQVERSLTLTSCNHSVHANVKSFVQWGILDRGSHAFQPAFEVFSSTSAVGCLEVIAWPMDLLITIDFARTVHALRNQDLNSFLRPVH